MEDSADPRREGSTAPVVGTGSRAIRTRSKGPSLCVQSRSTLVNAAASRHVDLCAHGYPSRAVYTTAPEILHVCTAVHRSSPQDCVRRTAQCLLATAACRTAQVEGAVRGSSAQSGRAGRVARVLHNLLRSGLRNQWCGSGRTCSRLAVDTPLPRTLAYTCVFGDACLGVAFRVF